MSSVCLVNCDCLDFLSHIASNSIDLVLIDPPYEVSRETGFKNGAKKGDDTDRFRISMNFGDWDNEGTVNLDKVLEECFRVLRKGGTIVCFYDLWKLTLLRNWMYEAGFKQIRFIEWLKTNPVPLNSKRNYLTNAREIALTGVKSGKGTFNSEYDNGVYEYPICHDRGRFHPTQKPLNLIEDIIYKHTNSGDVVLDCFSGSGTTAVASYNTGRIFVGCELNQEYYEKSVNRLKTAGCDVKIGFEDVKSGEVLHLIASH